MFQSKKGKKLYKFYKEKESIFIEHFINISKNYNEEDIHFVRSTSKRLKAILFLLEIIDENFSASKNFAVIKSVTKPAGKLREMQVNFNTLLSLTNNQSLLGFYRYWQQTNKADITNLLEEKISLFDWEEYKLNKKKIKKVCQETKGSKIKKSALKHIEVKLDKIKSLLKSERSELNTHEIRINLKQISPIVNLLQVLKFEGFTDDLLSEIKNSEDKLGAWHDRYELAETIRSILETSETIDLQIKEGIEKIQEQITTESNLFIQQFDKEIVILTEKLGALLLSYKNEKN